MSQPPDAPDSKAPQAPGEQQHYAADDRRWRDVGAGLSVLDLHQEGARRLQLVRLSPGGRLSAHQHAGAEITYVVRGSLVIDGMRLRAGDVLQAPAGSMHRETYSNEGCELVVECHPDDNLLRS